MASCGPGWLPIGYPTKDDLEYLTFLLLPPKCWGHWNIWFLASTHILNGWEHPYIFPLACDLRTRKGQHIITKPLTAASCCLRCTSVGDLTSSLVVVNVSTVFSCYYKICSMINSYFCSCIFFMFLLDVFGTNPLIFLDQRLIHV